MSIYIVNKKTIDSIVYVFSKKNNLNNQTDLNSIGQLLLDCNKQSFKSRYPKVIIKNYDNYVYDNPVENNKDVDEVINKFNYLFKDNIQTPDSILSYAMINSLLEFKCQITMTKDIKVYNLVNRLLDYLYSGLSIDPEILFMNPNHSLLRDKNLIHLFR